MQATEKDIFPQKTFLDSTFLIAIATGLLYSWQAAKYHGFLTATALEPNMMERSFNQMIYEGLVLSFWPLFLFGALITFFQFFLSHVFIPAFIDLYRKSHKVRRFYLWFKKEKSHLRVEAEIEKREKSRLVKFAFIFFVLFAYLVSLLIFEGKGHKEGEKIMDAHYENKINIGRIVTVTIEGKEKHLNFINCGSNNCAGIEKETNRTYYFPQSSGYSFMHESNSQTEIKQETSQ